MNIDFFCFHISENLIKKDAISKAIVANFYKNMKAFITAAVSKIMEKSPIGSVAVINASALEL